MPSVSASIVHVFTAPARGAPMQSHADAQAIAGVGLESDRYSVATRRRDPKREITLIEIEHIDAFTRDCDAAFTPEMPRRNVVTRDIRLNELVGRRFRIGSDVELEGLELCEPCTLFAKRTRKSVLQFFAGKGGLRARILTGGRLACGDTIAMIEPPITAESR